MRIVGGRKRGLALESVGKGDAAAHLRPTTDRTRESIFNILQGGRYGDPLDHARILDLFAGSGALGLEAWSRGAAHVTFVDDGRIAQRLIRANIEKAGAGDETTLLKRSALRPGQNSEAPYSLIFLDPPYGKGLGAKALDAARTGGWLSENALIVLEESAPQDPPEGIRLLECRRFGTTHVSFMRGAFGLR